MNSPLLNPNHGSDSNVEDERYQVCIPSAQNRSSDRSICYEDYGSLAGNQETTNNVRNEAVLTNKVWDELANRRNGHTSTRRELIVLINSSLPLIATFMLQFSLPIAAASSAGHLGKAELAAVSLAMTTANIMGFAMIQGLATCLDTLCSQAFGAGLIWWFSRQILMLVVGDEEIAHLAMVYLRILILAIPGYIFFECGKRYMQAQGIFHASTLILLVCAPLNMVMNYNLVWNKHIGIGYAGAPLSVVVTNWLMPAMLLLYARFVDGSRCWGGISRDILRNWGPMVKLAIPGFVMVEAEFFAYEVMTIVASRISITALAAQYILGTVTLLTYQIGFAVSISVATRVANFVGAMLEQPAVLASRVGVMSSFVIACFNGLLIYFLRYKIGGLFSNDESVIELVASAMPICAFLQLFDAPACISGGVLRGQGRQYLAGYLNIVCYYLIALPIGITLAFGWKLKLYGVWIGFVVGLLCVAIGSLFFVARSDWKQIILVASERDRDERVVSDD